MSSNEKVPTSLRSLAEQLSALAKTDPSVTPLGRPRTFSAKPLDIKVHVERNIRPIDWNVVEKYKQAMIRGDRFPPIDVSVEGGVITLRHGYHRTLAAQAAVKERPELAHLELELREFRGNFVDAIFLMLNSQDSLELDPVSRAESYLMLHNQGLNNSKIAARTGMSAEHVAQQLILVEAEESVKAFIREDKVKASTVIALIKEQKQGGANHVDAVNEMIANAESLGLTKATPKHRTRNAATPTTPKLKMKEVQRTLSSLVGIADTLRTALTGKVPQAGQSISEEQQDVLVPVELPASKIAELLALLEKQSPITPVDAAQDDKTCNEDQADMFADNGAGAA